MSVIEFNLARRQRNFLPHIEVLEKRECPAVAAPPGLTLTALSPTQVKVQWTNIAGENGYRVFKWDGAATTLVTQLAANTTTLTVPNLLANRNYWFTVEAFDAATTARAAWKSVNTLPDAITVPGNLRVGNVSQTQLSLLWNFANGAQGYRVYGWDGERAVLLGTVGNTVNSFVVNNLSPGATYYYYVQAFNATNSASTDWVTAQTTAISITAPTNVKATTVNTGTIGLSWNDAVGETGYRVYRWNGVSGAAPVVIATLAANVTGYQAIGLLPGKTYWFYIQSFNATASANSAWAQATTTIAVPLAPPTNVLTQVQGANSVRLTWTESARAVGYRVFVWSGTMWVLSQSVPAGTNQATVTGLPAYRTHWFMVMAYTDNFAEVSYSSAVFANL